MKKTAIIVTAIVLAFIVAFVSLAVVLTFHAIAPHATPGAPVTPDAVETPTIAPTVAPTATEAPIAAPVQSTTSSIVEALNSLYIEDGSNASTYERDLFGNPWEDVDNNGCDTRNDILNRDLINITYKTPGNVCVVQTGTLIDPYTGTTINFIRGSGTSIAVPIDHVFPLSLSWQHGADEWDANTRVQFANDPMNLIATTQFENSQKGDSSPSEWLPADASYHCEYLTDFVLVAQKYNLSITFNDYDVAHDILINC